jgi:hypothetical protein
MRRTTQAAQNKLTSKVHRVGEVLVRWRWFNRANVAVLVSLSELILIENDFLLLGRGLLATVELIGESLNSAVIVQIGPILIGNLGRKGRKGMREERREGGNLIITLLEIFDHLLVKSLFEISQRS